MTRRASTQCIIGLAWLMAGAAMAAGAADPLDALQGVYRRQQEAIAKAFEEACVVARDTYARELRALRRHMQRTGDEFGERPVTAELERFRREQTVPRDSAVGTPELLETARARYYEVVDAAAAERDTRLAKLRRQYVARLEALQERDAADPQAVARYAGEIERVSDGSVPDEETEAATITLPAAFQRGLAAAFTFEAIQERRVPDLSGNRRHGTLMGAKIMAFPDEGEAGTFTGAYGMLELDAAPLSASWTISARVRFPLAASTRRRVLASGGFGQDHVAVDPRGYLGATVDGRFAPSAFRVNELAGWHELTAVGTAGRTVFFLDGNPVASIQAVCGEPLKVIGNSGAGGQPWGGAVSRILAWHGLLRNDDVKALVAALAEEE